MKLPLSWLRDFAPVNWSEAEFSARMTMLGFEIESLAPVAPLFTGVLVAEIVSAEPHPQADKLRVCRVNSGAGDTLQIVCGAPNARAGLRTALATVGARLPGELHIKAAKLRGVESAGMLCSAAELQLAGGNAGIIELPADAPVGALLRDYLRLDELLVEIGITPNRGDAMSVLGLAREICAATGVALQMPAVAPVQASIGDTFAVSLAPGAGCARFASRVLRGVDNRRASPAWLRERLERSGLRSISPVVDVTNFVLLELGQPMHAYDLAKLQGRVEARLAAPGEPLTLLDGREIRLESDVLVIADAAGAVGMAGIFGGQRTAIDEASDALLLEVAWFDPARIAGRARRHGIQTDAGQRFERGVDPEGQLRALERATALILEIAGGQAGPVQHQVLEGELPARPAVPLRAKRIERVLGTAIAPERITATLAALGMQVQVASTADGAAGAWQVTPPSWRFDIVIEADLIEELARSIGLDALPEAPPRGRLRIAPLGEAHLDERSILELLVARGFHEAINFGFTDPQLQQQLFGAQPAVALQNPIAANLAVMRSSLWPGLLMAARENLRRQRERVRLFEIASRFAPGAPGEAPHESRRIAGLVLGSRLPEQWGADRADIDYFDLKGDLQALLALGGEAARLAFEPGEGVPGCLHPGRAARVLCDGQPIGVLGELHPEQVRALDLTYAPLLFDLEYEAVARVRPIQFRPLSAFPQIRRDISFTVPAAVPFGRIAERVNVAAATRLHELRLFDIYQGKGVETGRKSIALGLIFQDLSRTLTDADADEAVAAVRADLGANLDARIRD
jgi:phenylalanyl-tRNA synthetase beta chain